MSLPTLQYRYHQQQRVHQMSTWNEAKARLNETLQVLSTSLVLDLIKGLDMQMTFILMASRAGRDD